jgi:hypothetical protein
LTENSAPETDAISLDTLQKVYLSFHAFVADFVGDKKAEEFARQTYRLTCRYYRKLESLQLNEDNILNSENESIEDPEILGFSLWMNNFVNELKSFMIGVGDVELETIVGSLRTPLEKTGFFEYYQQAEELKYSE